MNSIRIAPLLMGALVVMTGNACDDVVQKYHEKESPYSFETLASFLQEQQNQHDNLAIVLVKSKKNTSKKTRIQQKMQGIEVLPDEESYWATQDEIVLHILNSPDTIVKNPLTRAEITGIDLCKILPIKNNDGSYRYDIVERNSYSGPMALMEFAVKNVPDTFFENSIDFPRIPSYNKFVMMSGVLDALYPKGDNNISRKALILTALHKVNVFGVHEYNNKPFTTDYQEQLAREAYDNFRRVVQKGPQSNGKLFYIIARFHQLSIENRYSLHIQLEGMIALRNECAQGISPQIQKKIDERVKYIEEIFRIPESVVGQ